MKKSLDIADLQDRVRSGVGRRISQRPLDTPRTAGTKFRRFLELKELSEVAARQLDAECFDRRDRVAELIDPTKMERRTEEAKRQSTLYNAAYASLHAPSSGALSPQESQGPLRSSSACGRKHASSASASRPDSRSSVLQYHQRRFPVNRPTQLNPYDAIVTTRYLEREKSEKPYAIAHATTETLSVGLIDTLVGSWYSGATTVTEVMAEPSASSSGIKGGAAATSCGGVDKEQLAHNMLRVTLSLQQQSERCRSEAFAAAVEVKRRAVECIERMREETLAKLLVEH